MKAFHNDPKVKEFYLARVKAHQAADEIIQGQYWENGKGCAVGCTLHSSDHNAYEIAMGIPRILARLEDRIFEGLSIQDSRFWPGDFLESIHVDADLSLVWPKFALWILTDPMYGVSQYNKSSAITDIAVLYQLLIDGKPPTIEEWKKASLNTDSFASDSSDSSAFDAAAAAADAAYSDSAAYDAAYAATYAANAAAANAAAAAAYSAVYSAADAYAAQKNWYKAASEKLLEILRDTKPSAEAVEHP